MSRAIIHPLMKCGTRIKIPRIGLGTWKMEDGKTTERVVRQALDMGYRHLDTAFIYENERSIGRAVRSWIRNGNDRKELFITTKLPVYGNRPEDVPRYLSESLRRLQLDYVDLYLVHHPFSMKKIAEDSKIHSQLMKNTSRNDENSSKHFRNFRNMKHHHFYTAKMGPRKRKRMTRRELMKQMKTNTSSSGKMMKMNTSSGMMKNTSSNMNDSMKSDMMMNDSMKSDMMMNDSMTSSSGMMTNTSSNMMKTNASSSDMMMNDSMKSDMMKTNTSSSMMMNDSNTSSSMMMNDSNTSSSMMKKDSSIDDDNVRKLSANRNVRLAWDYKTDHNRIWKAMENEVRNGRTRYIGLSNFNEYQVENVLRRARIKPAVLQIELHPYLQQTVLRRLSRWYGITLVAYSPLGSCDNDVSCGFECSLDNSAVRRIATELDANPAQVVLSYLLKLGVVVIPKAKTTEHLRENLSAIDLDLSSNHMRSLRRVDRGIEGRIFDFRMWKGVTKHPQYPFYDVKLLNKDNITQEEAGKTINFGGKMTEIDGKIVGDEGNIVDVGDVDQKIVQFERNVVDKTQNIVRDIDDYKTGNIVGDIDGNIVQYEENIVGEGNIVEKMARFDRKYYDKTGSNRDIDDENKIGGKIVQFDRKIVEVGNDVKSGNIVKIDGEIVGVNDAEGKIVDDIKKSGNFDERKIGWKNDKFGGKIVRVHDDSKGKIVVRKMKIVAVDNDNKTRKIVSAVDDKGKIVPNVDVDKFGGKIVQFSGNIDDMKSGNFNEKNVISDTGKIVIDKDDKGKIVRVNNKSGKIMEFAGKIVRILDDDKRKIVRDNESGKIVNDGYRSGKIFGDDYEQGKIVRVVDSFGGKIVTRDAGKMKIRVDNENLENGGFLSKTSRIVGSSKIKNNEMKATI